MTWLARALARALAGTLLLTLVAGVGTTPPASACSCAMSPPRDLAAAADAVFAAMLLEDAPDGGSGRVEYDVQVSRVYQGDVTGTVTISTGAQSSACGLTGMSAGEEWVFFAQGGGESLTTSSFSGSSPLVPRTVRSVERVLGPGAAVEGAGVPGRVAPDSTGLPGGLLVGLVGLVGAIVPRVLARRRTTG